MSSSQKEFIKLKKAYLLLTEAEIDNTEEDFDKIEDLFSRKFTPNRDSKYLAEEMLFIEEHDSSNDKYKLIYGLLMSEFLSKLEHTNIDKVLYNKVNKILEEILCKLD